MRQKRWIQYGYLILFVACIVVVDPGQGNAQERNKIQTEEYSALLSQKEISENSVRKKGKLISLNFSNLDLSDALKMLAEELSVGLAFDAGLTLNKKITIQEQSVTAYEALSAILDGTGLEAKIPEGRDIVFIKKKEEHTILLELLTGTVIDAQSGETLPGVNIIVKGTTTGTSTDSDGNFELDVPSLQDTLLVSFVGYQTREVPINGRTEIDIVLQSQAIAGDELVVIGYGTQQRRDLTGSIRSVNMDDMAPSANTDLMQSLRGYAAGLNITGGGGVAGDTPSFDIRGPTTLSASIKPLIVVDGVIYQGAINDININDVERVDILQDASAAAVYGARASNGVILITTKQGKSGQPSLRVSSYAGFQEHSNHPVQMMNADQYATRLVDYNWMQSLYGWYASNPTGPNDKGGKPQRPDVTDPQVVTGFLKSQMEVDNYLAGHEVDWYDIVTRRATIQNYNVSLSGNGDNYNYFISGSHIDQEGVLVNDRFKRNTLRTRVQRDVTDWFRIGINTFYAFRDHSGERVTLDIARNVTPLANVYNEEGNLPIEYNSEFLMRHPLRTTLFDNEDYSSNFQITGSALVEFPFLTGLSFDFTYSNSSLSRENKTYIPSNVYEGRGSSGEGTIFDEGESNWLINNILNYENDLGRNHSIDVTLLYTHESREGTYATASATRFENELLGYNNLGFAEESTISNGAWDETTLAYMGRINYGFKDRYLLTATIRRDGFSGFGPANKYAIFRSMSTAWIASDESFLDGTNNWLDLLKFRLSYGENGNQGIGRYSSLARMNMSKYVYGGNAAVGVIPSGLGNSSLGWEKTTQFNLGVDYALLKHRISGSIDVYTSDTEDVLVTQSLPGATGYGSIWTNISGVANKGIELELSTVNTESRVRWESRFIFSLNRDEITELYGDGRDDVGNSWFIGEPISAIYDYKRSGGVWTEEELYSGQIQEGFYPGQFKLRDFNGDGRIRPDDDRTIVGYATPNYRFSFGNTVSYKNFSLSVLFNSIQGGNGYYIRDNRTFLEATSAFDYAQRANQPAIRQNWLPGSGINNAPAIYNYPTAESGNYQDRSFIRLEDVSLSYSFSNEMLNILGGIQGLQLYINGKNLYTWTGWEGYDPEIANFDTPKMRVVTMGFRLDI